MNPNLDLYPYVYEYIMYMDFVSENLYMDHIVSDAEHWFRVSKVLCVFLLFKA
jgi:hypothetical protein